MEPLYASTLMIINYSFMAKLLTTTRQAFEQKARQWKQVKIYFIIRSFVRRLFHWLSRFRNFLTRYNFKKFVLNKWTRSFNVIFDDRTWQDCNGKFYSTKDWEPLTWMSIDGRENFAFLEASHVFDYSLIKSSYFPETDFDNVVTTASRSHHEYVDVMIIILQENSRNVIL